MTCPVRITHTLLLFLVAITPPARAAVIEGRVTDASTGTPIQYVSVSAGGAGRPTGTLTTAAGEYRLLDLAPGRYRLRFSYVGYTPVEEAVTLGEDATRRLDIRLTSGAIVLDEVTVVADPFRQERRVQAGFVGLEAKTLAGLPALGESDIVRGLQLLPGVQAASDVSSGLYVRGGGPDQTLILLDRLPLYNPTHAFGLFSTFNADAIDAVSLYKGAYPARYGGRLGAVLDVRQRDGGAERVRGRASMSTIAGGLTLEGPLERGSWMLAARRTYLDPLLAALSTPENPLPAYYFYDVNGRVRLHGDRNGGLEASVYMSRDALRLDLDAGSAFDLEWGNTAAALAYRHTLGTSATGSVSLSVSDYRSTSELSIFTTPIVFDNRVRDTTIRAELAAGAGDRHTLTGGIEGTRYEIGYVQRFNRDRGVEIDQRPWSGAAFLQDEWTPREGTDVRLGLRARAFELGQRTFLEPRLAAAQDVGSGVVVKAGAGITNQVLQLVASEGFSGSDFYLPIDATAPPGRSIQSILGVEWSPSRRYRTSIEGYYTHLDDVVVFDNESTSDPSATTSQDLFVTGGEGYAAGVELFMERRIGALTGWFGYTLGWTRRRFDEINEGKTFPPKYDRRHDLSLVLSLARGTWSYGASFVYATGQAFTPAAARYGVRDPATGQLPEGGQYLPAARNSARLLPYHRLDVSVEKRFALLGRPATWFVQVFNLYSRRNDWFVELDPDDPSGAPSVVRQLPIVPSAGLRVEF